MKSPRKRSAQMRVKPAAGKQLKRVKSKPLRPSRNKVRAHRARLRAKGMRPITIWVPDTRSRRFAAEAGRQCAAVNKSPRAAEDQHWVDSMQGTAD